MPKVSVIIPSFNHGKYIGEAINSVLNQTYNDYEIIITDDGSTDNSLKIIKGFNNKRIKLFAFNENRGACVAANNCIFNSSGEYIAMLSSDDIFIPKKLEKQVSFLDKHSNIGVVLGYPKMIDENGSSLPILLNNKFNSLFQKKNRDRYAWLNYFFNYGNCLCHPSALVRRDCYDKVGFYDQRYASLPDFDFWIRVCKVFEIYILEEELIEMRWLNNNANESGYSIENITRSAWEYKIILNKYLDLSVHDFNRIFPNSKVPTNETHSKILMHFQLAKIALEKAKPHKMFAMDLLYDLMNKKAIAEMLDKSYGFNYRELIITAGNNPLFPEIASKRFIITLIINLSKQYRKAIKNRIGRYWSLFLNYYKNKNTTV